MPYREAPSQSHTGRRCPRCKAELIRQALGPNQVERCASCHGVWIAAAEFNQLLADLDRLEAVRKHELLHREPEQAVSYIACPRCSEIMERLNFGRSSGIMVDTCKRHGIWLDRGELRRVAEHLTGRTNTAAASEPPDDLSAPAKPARRARASSSLSSSSPASSSSSSEHDPILTPGQSTLLEFLLSLVKWPFD